MNTVPIKLETALVAHLVATWQGVGEELNGATIIEGHRSSDNSTADRVIVLCDSVGGPHARQGNYEVSTAFIVETNSNDQPTDSVTSKALHEKRVEALAGIFGETRVGTVCAALMVLDTELGVSSYWGYEREQDFDGSIFRTILRKTVAAHLV